jgi:outer membrane biogenesis lipoprotein LolB
VSVALLLPACAARPLTLPAGPSTPLADADALESALRHCERATTLTAEIGLSGRAAGQRVRGTLHAGFAPPDSIRLEAVAPFGGPIFLLAGQAGQATLLLPREDRVLRDAEPGAILESLAGLNVAPGELAAWVSGCPAARGSLEDPRSYGPDWIAADVSDGRSAWVRRQRGTWHLTALTTSRLTVEFAEHVNAQPGQIRIRRADAAEGPAIDLRLAIRQVERGIELSPAAFAVDVPDGAVPITLDDLRQSGPLRDRQ